jgi:hypothetical protein
VNQHPQELGQELRHNLAVDQHALPLPIAQLVKDSAWQTQIVKGHGLLVQISANLPVPEHSLKHKLNRELVSRALLLKHVPMVMELAVHLEVEEVQRIPTISDSEQFRPLKRKCLSCIIRSGLSPSFSCSSFKCNMTTLMATYLRCLGNQPSRRKKDRQRCKKQ